MFQYGSGVLFSFGILLTVFSFRPQGILSLTTLYMAVLEITDLLIQNLQITGRINI